MQSRWVKSAFAWVAVLGVGLIASGCPTETTGSGGNGGTSTTTTTTPTTGGGGSTQTCSKAEDCPEPGSECVERACKGGFCETTQMPNGADAPTQTAGDCQKNICAGGEVIKVEDSADLPEDDGTKCTVEACALGQPVTTQAPVGAECDDEGGKVCNMFGNCVACVENEDCMPGQVCNPFNACVTGQCIDGIKSGDESDIDCGGSCGATCELGMACNTGTDCVSDHCADGVCCDVACDMCAACTKALTGVMDGTCVKFKVGEDPQDECDPEPGNPCGNTDGFCSGQGQCNKVAFGTVCDVGKICSGTGVCGLPKGQPCLADGDCATGFCADDLCCAEACDGVCEACVTAQTGSLPDGTCGPVVAGTDPEMECPGVMACNGMSACEVLPNGSSCAQGSDCASGFCIDGVCCNTLCSGTCQACSTALKGSGMNGTCGGIGVGLDPEDECIADTKCNGSGACLLLANGQACTLAGECSSGFCTDEVCCNMDCSGACEACTTALKGSGANGACGPIATGTDPDDECAGAAVCAAMGACKLPNAETCAMNAECASTFCADGVCCNTACGTTCQACTTIKKGSGSDGTCGAIALGQDPDSECPGVTSCNGGNQCQLLAGGQACTLAAECTSQFCVDDVCCNVACGGACQACTTVKKGSGANGTCGPVATGTDPDSECAGAAVCDAMGACKQPDATACAMNSQCASGFCVDGVCCNNACNTTCQACTNAKKGSGNDGVCGSIAAGQDPDSECVGATSCSGAGQCTLFIAGQTCAQNAECQSNFCVDFVCCNSACGGACQACTTAKKGSGANGTCGSIAPGTDPDNECTGALACDTQGGCKLPDGAICALNTECVSGFCADGVCCNNACTSGCQACTAAKKGTGTDGVCGNILNGSDPDNECGGATVCNGAGQCALLPTGAACTVDSECVSVACVDGFCCNAACTNSCEACSQAKKGSGSNGTCGPIASGSDPDSECTGALVCNGSGACKGPLGFACATGTECLSTFCADGVCCGGACNTACQACTAAKKGSGTDGTCGSIGAGLDPDSECTGATSCNGSGACALFALGTACSLNGECQSTFCADGVCCNSSCNTLCQTCTAAKKGTGTDGTCGSVAVSTDPDNECPGGTNCNGNMCALFANGTPCTLNAECVSTQCADGVCCNTSCTGLCQACTAALKGSGSDGTCGNIAAGSDPAAECPGAQTCNGAGVCQ